EARATAQGRCEGTDAAASHPRSRRRRRRPDRHRLQAGPGARPRAREAARRRREVARAEHEGSPPASREGARAVIAWEQPGYDVAFTTRVGGVSEGVYESLNLTNGTGDDPERVEENRRRACESLSLPYERLSFNRQVHSPTVHRAGGRGAPGDGLWTDEPDVPMLAFSADCLPIAIARTDGPRRLAVVRAGWRGLSEGVVDAAVGAVGGTCAAVVGPAIGPCCYEVGPEVSALFDD